MYDADTMVEQKHNGAPWRDNSYGSIRLYKRGEGEVQQTNTSIGAGTVVRFVRDIFYSELGAVCWMKNCPPLVYMVYGKSMASLSPSSYYSVTQS